MNVIYYINDTNVWYCGSVKYIYDKLSEAGRHRDVDWEMKRLEVLVLLIALGELPRVGRNWAAVEYPKKDKRKKRREGKCEYITCTQQV